MQKETYTKEKLKKIIEEKLSGYYGLTMQNAETKHLFKAVALLTRDILSEKRRDFRIKTKKDQAKQVYYFCMEFLIGKQLRNNLCNLGIENEIAKVMNESGFSLDDLYEIEPDPGLGNGGLGRLAACFMDSLATMQYPAVGYSLRYEFGLFKQKLVDGWQVEFPDNWLQDGEVFMIPRTDYTVNVKFGGYIEENWEDGNMTFEYKDYQTIEAVPYDYILSGYHTDGASVLRLWRAKSPTSIDVTAFSQGDYLKAIEETARAEAISKVLYPADNHYEGKALRLKQQYFLVSASLQNILARHRQTYPSFDNLHEKTAIHINDTHPTFAIPELMRLLMDEYGYDWEAAWHITTNTMAYTNHTILSEALETWPEQLVQTNMPRIYSIICEINKRLCADLWEKYPGDWEKIQKMSIIAFNQVRMANLCIAGGYSINGVAKLHSEILREIVFKDFHEYSPEKFTNVTNGIAHRRWLIQANPLLTEVLDECIGTDYRTNARELEKFKKFAGDSAVLKRLEKIKQHNKIELANYAGKKLGMTLNPDSVFNSQVKRMHEYKRQLLNVLRIISVYNEILENPTADILPQTYIFAAKAAPSYTMAKNILKLIYCLGEDIRKNPRCKDKLSVVFMEDYSVSLAEKIIPASEVSQQISQAGKEASGTGNMKLMMNGALTIGTMDGANIEIADAVGKANIFIFGLTAKEVDNLWASKYDPDDYYIRNEKLIKVIISLNNGFNGESFQYITQSLLSAHYVADPYMCIADFADYDRAHTLLEKTYLNKAKWNEMSLMNIASAGIFAADRSIKEYADNIWHINPVYLD
ncbi:glycogen phosphorylase [Holotrichia oblita]|nr:glycogen phosphorylase [Holotrichia oblita]